MDGSFTFSPWVLRTGLWNEALSPSLYISASQGTEALSDFSQGHTVCKSKKFKIQMQACLNLKLVLKEIKNLKSWCCLLFIVHLFSMASTIIKVKLIMYERQSVNSLLRSSESDSFAPCRQILLRGYMQM